MRAAPSSGLVGFASILTAFGVGLGAPDLKQLPAKMFMAKVWTIV